MDTAEVPVGQIPAAWDQHQSGVLEASFAFRGSGVLGRFAPDPSAVQSVTFDTNFQTFPFADGSTPDAPAGFTVIGGVFEFTTIDVPDGVTVRVVGQNPLVFSATGSVRIAGVLDLDAGDGTDENAIEFPYRRVACGG